MQQSSLKKLIALAFSEDKVFNDLTSDYCLKKNLQTNFVIRARDPLVFCGKEIIELVFKQIKTKKKFKNAKIKIEFLANDGDYLQSQSLIVKGQGDAKLIFATERIILNFIQHLSGISTYTYEFVKKLQGTKIKILDTRKTLPGYRHLEKYAVKCAGGYNHRFNLNDRILIKDNHLANCLSSIPELLIFLKKKIKKKLIEIECDNYQQVLEAIKSSPDIIMLDNMKINDLQNSISAIRKANKKIIIEVSGGINLSNINHYRDLDIDFISIGSITHSAKAVDIGLDVV